MWLLLAWLVVVVGRGSISTAMPRLANNISCTYRRNNDRCANIIAVLAELKPEGRAAEEARRVLEVAEDTLRIRVNSFSWCGVVALQLEDTVVLATAAIASLKR